jgi:HEAT repeats
LKKDVAERPNVKELARLPALLGVLVGLAAAGDAGTDDRLTLYRRVFERLTGDDDRERHIERLPTFNALGEDADFSVRRAFARFVAFERLFDAEATARFRFSGERLHAEARRFCAANPEMLGKFGVPLVNWLKESPLLRETGADEYVFAHLTIQEFLAAEALVARPDCERRLCAATFDRQLAELETLPMALGLAKEPDALYAALEALPESLDLANLRIRARGLAYAGDALAQTRIDALANCYVQFLRREIGDATSPYRDATMKCFLSATGRARRVMVERLLVALRDKLGVDSPEVTARLLPALRDNDRDMQWHAAQALERTVEKSPSAFLEGLRLALTDSDSDARRIAAKIIGYYAEDDATRCALEELATNGPNEDIRAVARDAARRYARKLSLFGATPDASSDATAT